MGKILLCDDEESLCRSLGRILRAAGHEVVTLNGEAGLLRLREERFDLILTDIRMPEVSGFEILAAARLHAPSTPVIAMSGSAEIPDAVRAMHAGARDFLIKPFEVRTLEEAVAAVLKPAPPAEPQTDALAWRDKYAPWLLGNDPAMLPALKLIAQVADTGCTVLIQGASGTGKELAARSLHAGSARHAKAFVPVNCAAIPPNLVESELFGHTKGAFTGASSTRVGRFAQADGGTIFLDEIGEMEIGVQAKLLRLIQDGELYPVGEETPTRIDVRILAATNRNLEREVAAGRFRADLFWRLNVIPVELPTLGERAADMPVLVEHFLKRSNERHKRHVDGVEPQAMAVLEAYPWPGNIRELENLVERLVIVKGSGVLTPADLPAAMRASRVTPPQG
ncbi:MAG TPA: sigma-54 dependent transcriptional regulator, partial [Polyangia bacterium]